MKANYKRLWKLLIDKDMKKKDLMEQANISSFSIYKLNRGENVTMDVLGKICKALNCTLDDICEFEYTNSKTDSVET
ncbi:MAG: hypothetical protein K0S61_292 [Anaerocolumna sp.]|jgi:DNA-binding Xre family transcriptional regulator|nr:hypothetical protein [Anaerocolumna sp.]